MRKAVEQGAESLLSTQGTPFTVSRGNSIIYEGLAVICPDYDDDENNNGVRIQKKSLLLISRTSYLPVRKDLLNFSGKSFIVAPDDSYLVRPLDGYNILHKFRVREINDGSVTNS